MPGRGAWRAEFSAVPTPTRACSRAEVQTACPDGSTNSPSTLGGQGEIGELAARGPYTIRGYLAAPDRNREAFTAEGFYRSGDLVRARRYDGVLPRTQVGRVSKVTLRADIGAKLEHETTEPDPL